MEALNRNIEENIEVQNINPQTLAELGRTAIRMSVLEALAEPVEFFSPNRSNMSTPPRNTDFDDQ